jgi:hypothetical protein
MCKALSSGAAFSCGVGFHPSIALEGRAHGMDAAGMARGAAERAPLLLCVAGNDAEDLKPPDGDVARAISSSMHDRGGTGAGAGRSRPRCVVFPEMVHGWVSRGDVGSDNVRRDAEGALKMAVDFLADWM